MVPASVGLLAYNYDRRGLLDLARAAERLGFDALWFGEHYAIPRIFDSAHVKVYRSAAETPSDGVPSLSAAADRDEKEIIASDVRLQDPWLLMSLVAAVTERLRVGTAICIAPMLHPLQLARASATMADMSGERFSLGVGAGWLREEFDAYGIPFHERGARLDEGIAILRKAWRGGYFDHEGKHFGFGPLQITPRPLSVPIVCGGNSGPALRRVARVADAWMNSATVELEEALRLRDGVEAERRAQGTDARPFRYYLRPASPDERTVEAFVREGFTDLVFFAPEHWPQDPAVDGAEKVARLEAFARRLGLTA